MHVAFEVMKCDPLCQCHYNDNLLFLYQEMEILNGTFEIWQGKKSITVTPGCILMQPSTLFDR